MSLDGRGGVVVLHPIDGLGRSGLCSEAGFFSLHFLFCTELRKLLCNIFVLFTDPFDMLLDALVGIGPRCSVHPVDMLSLRHNKSFVQIYRFTLKKSNLFVAQVGLEPTPPCGEQILSLSRIPVPPLSHLLLFPWGRQDSNPHTPITPLMSGYKPAEIHPLNRMSLLPSPPGPDSNR